MKSRKEFLEEVSAILDEAGRVLENDAEIIEEIKDILHDYDQQAAQLQAMIQKYEQADRPVKNGDIYTCPECGHRVNPRHTHCHRCGKKLGGG